MGNINFIHFFTFSMLQKALGDYTFVPFSVLLLLFVLFTFFFVPETKNKTFEEVSGMWKKDKRSPEELSLKTGMNRSNGEMEIGSGEQANLVSR